MYFNEVGTNNHSSLHFLSFYRFIVSSFHRLIASSPHRLIVELPVHTHLEVSALHRVTRRGDVAEVEKTGYEIAAAHEEGDSLHSYGQMGVEIEVVASDDVLLCIELMQDRIVAVGVVFCVVEQIHTDLEAQPFLENAGGVERSQFTCKQRNRNCLVGGVLQCELRVQTEIFRADRRIKHQLDYLEGLLQLDGLKIVVKVNITAGIDEIEGSLVVENRPIGACFEEILLSPVVFPEVVVAEIVAEDVVGRTAAESGFQSDIMSLLPVDGESETGMGKRIVLGIFKQIV